MYRHTLIIGHKHTGDVEDTANDILDGVWNDLTRRLGYHVRPFALWYLL